MKKIPSLVTLAACASSPSLNSFCHGDALRRWNGNGALPKMPRGGDDSQNKGNEDDNSGQEESIKPRKKTSSPDKSRGNKKNKKSKMHQRTNGEETSSASSSSSQKASKTAAQEILRQDDFYEILGVSPSASDRDITKAYRRRCVQTHPDKTGGDRRSFDKVAEAYGVLHNEEKRELYDRFGKAGLEQGGPAAATAASYQDVFRNMFKQAAQQRRYQQQRNHSLRYQLEVSLEELYHGRTKNVVVSPPFSHLHYSSPHRRKQKEVDVHIPKGFISGQTIVLSGEVDFNDEATPGDLIFVITQAPHPKFTRKGHDLAMELSIGLDEALCGLQRPIHHLNGDEVLIGSAKSPNEKPIIIQTGDVQVLKGWGMPKRNQSGEFGDLYIQYRVEMPKARNGNLLTDDELRELSRLLTKLQGTENHLSQEESRLHKQQKNANKSGGINFSGEWGGRGTDENDELHILHEAKPTDFGRASGAVHWDEEDGFHEDHGNDFHPFASAASDFFQTTGDGARGSGRSFYFGGNPFGGGNPFEDNDGNVQCQQM